MSSASSFSTTSLLLRNWVIKVTKPAESGGAPVFYKDSRFELQLNAQDNKLIMADITGFKTWDGMQLESASLYPPELEVNRSKINHFYKLCAEVDSHTHTLYLAFSDTPLDQPYRHKSDQYVTLILEDVGLSANNNTQRIIKDNHLGISHGHGE